MQKIFSTRLDEATLDEMSRTVRRLGISKRRFLEEAIRQRLQDVARHEATDVWSETRGAWRRRGSPAGTVQQARRAFQRSSERHHRSR
jgi:hypothetical protein